MERVCDCEVEKARQANFGDTGAYACVLEDDDEIEFTPMTNQEKEKVPLMEIQADHMEII